jgi:hypothetical protein
VRAVYKSVSVSVADGSMSHAGEHWGQGGHVHHALPYRIAQASKVGEKRRSGRVCKKASRSDRDHSLQDNPRERQSAGDNLGVRRQAVTNFGVDHSQELSGNHVRYFVCL